MRWVGGADPFADPVRAKEQAVALHGAGVDVMLTANSGGDVGVFEAATEAGFDTFDVDVDHCAEAPGHVVDAVLKRVDNAIGAAVDRIVAGDDAVLPRGPDVRAVARRTWPSPRAAACVRRCATSPCASARTSRSDSLTLEFEPGTVHALVGENGAGKSTAVNVLFGLRVPDAGTVLIDGEPRRFGSPRSSSRACGGAGRSPGERRAREPSRSSVYTYPLFM